MPLQLDVMASEARGVIALTKGSSGVSQFIGGASPESGWASVERVLNVSLGCFSRSDWAEVVECAGLG